jgi:hypothetical protein
LEYREEGASFTLERPQTVFISALYEREDLTNNERERKRERRERLYEKVFSPSKEFERVNETRETMMHSLCSFGDQFLSGVDRPFVFCLAD